jgi:hypothetical protein
MSDYDVSVFSMQAYAITSAKMHRRAFNVLII